MTYIDAFEERYPKAGPCAFCGDADSRHRVADSFASLLIAGDTVAETAKDYDVSEETVIGALLWTIRRYRDAEAKP